MEDRDLAHEFYIKTLTRDQLILDCGDEEPVLEEPWPLEDLDF